jgi:hypothetical protein
MLEPTCACFMGLELRVEGMLEPTCACFMGLGLRVEGMLEPTCACFMLVSASSPPQGKKGVENRAMVACCRSYFPYFVAYMGNHFQLPSICA